MCLLACGCAGGQWQRAVDLYDKLQSQGSVTPSSATVSAVVVSLSQAGQSQRAEQLLTSAATSVKQQHAGDGAGAAAASQALVPAWNTLLRAMAKSGDHLQALVLLERLVLREEVAVFDETVSIGHMMACTSAATSKRRALQDCMHR